MTGAFFSSRWLSPLDHVTELGGTGLAPGFRAAGVAAGIKAPGILDVGVLVSTAPQTTSAARFTASGVLAPPVLICTERCELGALRAVVVNSGNANAATGRPGFDNAAKMQGAGALVAGVPEGQVAVASTGVIGSFSLGNAANRARGNGVRSRIAQMISKSFSALAAASVEAKGSLNTLTSTRSETFDQSVTRKARLR